MQAGARLPNKDARTFQRHALVQHAQPPPNPLIAGKQARRQSKGHLARMMVLSRSRGCSLRLFKCTGRLLYREALGN